MSTHNVCFCGEIRKILCGYPLLSVAMAGFYAVSLTLLFYFSLLNYHKYSNVSM